MDRTVALGEPLTRPSISVIASDASLRLRARFASQPDYDRATFIAYEQPARNTFVIVAMTAAYAALAGGYDLDVPDLAAVSGFDASWMLRPGLLTSWTASRLGGTVPLGRNAVPVNGAVRRTTSTGDAITLP